MDHEAVEEIKRHFGIVAEDIRGEVRGVAEGVAVLPEEMHREFEDFRTETAREFEETRALFRLS